jgi:putative endonuclease
MEWQPSCSHPRSPTTQTIGAEAELAARHYLEQQGCAHVNSNYRSRRGEIDLIMREGNRLLFVEVRLRKHDAFGGAIGSITYAKQQKIIASARAFLHHHPHFYTLDCRFDVITLQRHAERWQIEWLPGAFTL